MMAGQKGKSGGARPGVGRKPQSVRVRHGQEFLLRVYHINQDGDVVGQESIEGYPSAIVNVEVIGRGKFRLITPEGTVYDLMEESGGQKVKQNARKTENH